MFNAIANYGESSRFIRFKTFKQCLPSALKKLKANLTVSWELAPCRNVRVMTMTYGTGIFPVNTLVLKSSITATAFSLLHF